MNFTENTTPSPAFQRALVLRCPCVQPVWRVGALLPRPAEEGGQRRDVAARREARTAGGERQGRTLLLLLLPQSRADCCETREQAQNHRQKLYTSDRLSIMRHRPPTPELM